MRVFSVPVSAPFLRSVIAALVDGRLVDGFEARAHPENLARATLYLPTRRAGRMAREVLTPSRPSGYGGSSCSATAS
jgi:ATP-dependent helicase/nuclease subunit B